MMPDPALESTLKPLPGRPHILRQRSQSASVKSSVPLPDITSAQDSDASLKRTRGGHRHTQSHHHIPHHPKRFVKDRLGQLQSGLVNTSTAELSKTSSRVSTAPKQQQQADSEASGSRKGSLAKGQQDGGGTGTLVGGVSGEELDRQTMQEQWKNQKRQQELQRVLHRLSEESMRTTRKLDDLYYNMLEKLSGLYATISNLQELAALTAELHENFRHETNELKSDLRRQIDAFGGFKAQQQALIAVDRRVHESKAKADKLSERMDLARKRVSVLEVMEKEWQDSVTYRLRWMWSILAMMAGLLLAFFATSAYNATVSPSDVPADPRIATLSLATFASVPASVKSVLEEVIGQTVNTSSTATSTPARAVSISSRISKLMEPTTPVDRDALLRIFDRL